MARWKRALPCKLLTRAARVATSASVFRFIALCLLATSFLSPLPAQTIQVVTRDVEPFSFEKDGRRTGFAIELWENLAAELKLQSNTTVVGTAKEMVQAVQEKKADVGVGALSITAEREQVIDFTQPFFAAGQEIVVAREGGGGNDAIWSALGMVFNWKFIGSFALLVFVMLVVSHLVWLYEHKINEEMWPKNYAAGMWESFWWTISTLLVGGADNKGPVGVGGRLVAIAWMLLSIVLLALLTGSFAANLTAERLAGDINGPGDLKGKWVGTVGGSASVRILEQFGARVKPYDNVRAALDALNEKQVKAVVYDAPMINYALKEERYADLTTVGNEFNISNYGFALQQDSPLREPLNRALLTLSENGVTAKLRAKYFDAE
jgi:polar amino acid transport system substrate-binding protein